MEAIPVELHTLEADAKPALGLVPVPACRRLFYLLTYLALLVTNAWYLREVEYSGPLQAAFLASVYATYTMIYLIPGFLLLELASAVLGRVRGRAFPLPFAWSGIAIGITGGVHMFFFADRFIFRIFGFHVNGFVLNLVSTRGGIESMGGSTSSTLVFTLIAVGFGVLQAFLLAAAVRATREGSPARAWSIGLVRPRSILLGFAFLVALGLFERCTFAISTLRRYNPVISAATTFPFYLPFTSRRLGRWLGLTPTRDTDFKVRVDQAKVKYPLAPIERAADAPRYNIVWLVAESLRWDMLDPEIMPATWAFAKKSTHCLNHFSGGNGTRMGMFAMFYGLYGPNWFSFLPEQRGPLIMDLLLEDNYQMELFTSARFTYPEFDHTIFARVPAEHLHEAGGGPGWQRDRKNVDAILEFLKNRDRSRPFMTFEFFESTHANYHFPPECAIRKPYMEELNYATVDLEREMGQMKNRYINSARHLDTQIERILKFLEAEDLIKNTIVIVTGDHGEEFLEKGRWGHNSAFSDEQIRPPLAFWIPGTPPREITHMTSHLDICVTVMKALGVKNPTRDYALGLDILGEERRQFTVLAGWDTLALVDDSYTAVFPIKSMSVPEYRTRAWKLVEDPVEFLKANKERLSSVLKDLKRFTK